MKLKVSARGTALKYQWYRKAPKATSWKKVSGATSRILTVTKASSSASKTRYRVNVTGRKGKVVSRSATLTVREAYKPLITTLSAAGVETGKTARLTITGKNFHDITRVYIAGEPVSFRKSGTTRLTVTVPVRSYEDTTTVTVASTTGKSSKPFRYFTYLSAIDRADYLSSIDSYQRAYGAPTAPVRTAYDAARRYIQSPGAYAGDAYNHYRIAGYAIDYCHYMGEAADYDLEYNKYKNEYYIAVRYSDSPRIQYYKSLMDESAASRDAYRESAALALQNIRDLGGKL
ncbi:MAG: IPT/TIG domain-containing protein [Actinomycetota bacterium]